MAASVRARPLAPYSRTFCRRRRFCPRNRHYRHFCRRSRRCRLGPRRSNRRSGHRRRSRRRSRRRPPVDHGLRRPVAHLRRRSCRCHRPVRPATRRRFHPSARPRRPRQSPPPNFGDSISSRSPARRRPRLRTQQRRLQSPSCSPYESLPRRRSSFQSWLDRPMFARVPAFRPKNLVHRRVRPPAYAVLSPATYRSPPRDDPRYRCRSLACGSRRWRPRACWCSDRLPLPAET
jgi:hypothetical protein